jgi:hypothetical protein
MSRRKAKQFDRANGRALNAASLAWQMAYDGDTPRRMLLAHTSAADLNASAAALARALGFDVLAQIRQETADMHASEARKYAEHA